jgi:predicted transcriptional regulator
MDQRIAFLRLSRRIDMARPRHESPTPAELEVLQVIWERGPSTVREVMSVLNRQRPRAYTSVMSLMNVMVEKGLLRPKPKGRAFVYFARVSQTGTQSEIVKDLLNRVFDGSASALVTHLLTEAKPDSEELEEIRKTISEFARKKGGA